MREAYETTFEIFKFGSGNWTPPVGMKAKMDSHVSLGFLGSSNLNFLTLLIKG